MKNINTKNNIQSKERGYTMMEMMVVLVVIIGLIAAVIAGFGALKSSSNEKLLNDDLINGFPTAIARCLSRTPNDLSACTAARITTSGFSSIGSTTTVCGDTWSATASAAQVVIVYPLGGCNDADDLGAAFDTRLDSITKTTASYDSATEDLTITLSR